MPRLGGLHRAQGAHHRVKNNLQVIYSLLSLQMQGGGGSDASLLEDARQRVKTMALVHETLYGATDLAHITARDFIASVAENLVRIYRAGEQGVQLVVAADEIQLDIDQAVPLGLIINELSTNAFKYAFHGRAGGSLRISLHRTDQDSLELQVSDDGVGISAAVNLHQPASLGLRLVGALAQQLGGELTVARKGGTQFSIRFPFVA